MRVTEQFRSEMMLRNLFTRSSRLNDVYERLATQKEVLRPSDDPVKTGVIMRVTSQLKQLEQSVSSIESAQTVADAVGEALDGSTDIIMRARTLGVRAANATLSTQERLAVADELNQLLESLVDFGNQKFEGRALFAGVSTDKQALTVVRDADGDIASISYTGSQDPLEAPLGRGRTLQTSINGDELFLDTNLLPSLISLRDALRNTGGLSEENVSANIRDSLGQLNAAADAFGSLAGQYAARVADLDLLLQQAEAATTRASEVVSRVSDVDLAQVAMDLQREQTIYQAILQVGSQISSTSLLDYLK